MTAMRSEIIREVETDLIESRARGYLKHRGQTYTEYKIERARKWRAIKQGLWVLLAVSLVVLLWVMR